MASLSAEIYFKKGLAALVAQNFEDASKLFRQALDLERDRGARHPDMRYLSYYGLSLARAGHSTSTAIQACRTAAMKQRGDPVLYLNLGRVYLLARRIGPAAAAFEQGLAVAPDHKVLARELAEIDRRAKPVLSMVSRSHPLNRWLGRVRRSRSNGRGNLVHGVQK